MRFTTPMVALGWIIMSKISIFYMVFADIIGLIVSTGDINNSTLTKTVINYSTLTEECDDLGSFSVEIELTFRYFNIQLDAQSDTLVLRFQCFATHAI